jgi:hypothetical protein
MLKSAARRLGIAEIGSSDAPYKKRTALAALLVRAWAAAVRLARLGVRFIRLRT